MKKAYSAFLNIIRKVGWIPYSCQQIDQYRIEHLDPDSSDGRHLLLRTEFHGQSEYRTVVSIARRRKEDPEIPQSKLLMGEFYEPLLRTTAYIT